MPAWSDGFSSSAAAAAAKCLGNVPDVDSKATSTAHTMASKLQLPSAVLVATPCSASHSFIVPWRGYSLSLLALYQSSLGQRLGHEPSGMGQGLG